MKAYRIHAYTGPRGLQRVDEPDLPAPVGRQVIVRIRATSINYRDLIDTKGWLAHMQPLAERRIPCCDGAGEVLAVGPDVTRVKPGDRVAAIFHAGWIGGAAPWDLDVMGRGAKPNDGMLAEMTCVDESELVHIPAHLSFEEAATLPCAGVTAWYSLFGPARLMPGETVLVQGSGGVSMFALQFARQAGARVIATTTSPSKADVLRQYGAETVIDAANGPDWAREVLRVTGGRGCDWTLEIAGGGTFESSVAATRPGGRLVMIGAREKLLKNLSGMFMMRGLNIHVTRVGSREHFEQMNMAITTSDLRPVIGASFDFADAPAAFEQFEQAKHVGKVVIRI